MKALKPTQIQVAHLMAEGVKACDAAKKVGVTAETISIWRRNPAFQAYCNELREELVSSARDRLRANGPTAVDTLSDLMRVSRSESIKLKAAGMLLNHLGLGKNGNSNEGIGSTAPNDFTESSRRRQVLDDMLGDLSTRFSP